nr:MAG TPA_asm: hypothetical protein [Caudoviricetes sp.]
MKRIFSQNTGLPRLMHFARARFITQGFSKNLIFTI